MKKLLLTAALVICLSSGAMAFTQEEKDQMITSFSDIKAKMQNHIKCFNITGDHRYALTFQDYVGQMDFYIITLKNGGEIPGNAFDHIKTIESSMEYFTQVLSNFCNFLR